MHIIIFKNANEIAKMENFIFSSLPIYVFNDVINSDKSFFAPKKNMNLGKIDNKPVQWHDTERYIFYRSVSKGAKNIFGYF